MNNASRGRDPCLVRGLAETDALDDVPRAVPVSARRRETLVLTLPADPYLSIGSGRSRFRVADLLALADLVAARRTR